MNVVEAEKLAVALIANVVDVEFTKADGSVRHMRCTKDFGLIPVDQHPTPHVGDPVLLTTDLEKVFDLQAQAWRSFKPSRVISWYVEVNE